LVDTTAVDFTTTDRNNLLAILQDTGTDIPAQVSALNNLSSAQAQTAAAAALTAYDPPTNAEMEARTLVAAGYATAAKLLSYFQSALRKDVTTDADIGGTYDDATDSQEAIRDRGDTAWGSAGGGATAAEVWAYGDRTLTSPGGSVPEPLAGGVLTIRRDTTVQLSLTGAGAIDDRERLWFAVKREPRDDDDEAVLLIEETDGLTRIEGEEPEVGVTATLVVIDEDAGDVDITLPADTSALLSVNPRGRLMAELKVRRDDGTVSSLATWRARVEPAIVRATE